MVDRWCSDPKAHAVGAIHGFTGSVHVQFLVDVLVLLILRC